MEAIGSYGMSRRVILTSFGSFISCSSTSYSTRHWSPWEGARRKGPKP